MDTFTHVLQYNDNDQKQTDVIDETNFEIPYSRNDEID